ncbi:MAG: hypothetical protein R2867_42660 [Caldilineaceae bacterium]
MRRTIIVLTVSPLVLMMALIYGGQTMARANTESTIETATLVNSFPRDGANRAQAATAPLAQVTTTVPTTGFTELPLGPRPGTVTPTIAISATPVTTATTVVTEAGGLSDELATPTNTVSLTTVQVLTNTTPETPDSGSTDAVVADDGAYALPIEGTIVANRTDATIRFFVEGATYTLDAQRALGLDLPRVTAVLNLFNCDANTPETTEGCFWDPYLLDRDGFYEIVADPNTTVLSGLTLQPAGSPPINQILIQNRTGKRESIFYQDEEIELPPAGIREFTSSTDVPAIFYLRSCLALSDRTVCEWKPTEAEPGIYYALEETTVVGGLPNSEITALELHPILSKDGDPIETPLQLTCQLQVPTLNVRSGPGLEYQIIAKIRGTDAEPGRFTAIGREALGEWLAVDTRIAAGGWVTASPSFVACNGDINTLPIAEVTDGRLAPTPVPAVPATDSATDTTPAESSPEGTTDEGTGTTDEGSGTTDDLQSAVPQSIPQGQALIIVNNGFDQQIRFTLDQRYRVELGVSEYDLQPGESISFFVYPGQLAFSVSSPWRGLSGNSEFFIDNQESRTLWLVFMPDPDGSGRWILQY